MAVDETFRQNWLQMQDEYGSGIDSGDVIVMNYGDIDATVSIPAVKFSAPYTEGGTNQVVDYRHVPIATLARYAQDVATQIQEDFNDWFGETDDTTGEPEGGVRKDWKDFFDGAQEEWGGDEGLKAEVVEQAQRAEAAADDWGDNTQGLKKDVNDIITSWTTPTTGYKAQIEKATSDAAAAAVNANNAADGAEKVDASLSGTTITVKGRDGVPHQANLKGETGAAAGFGTPQASVVDNTPGTPSVTITASGSDTAKVFSFVFSHLKGDKGDKGDPFAIYRTYASIELMVLDKDNVPDGKLTCIDSSVEDPDNAKLFVRDSTQTTKSPIGFGFLTDLSGAQGIKGDKGDEPVITADADGTLRVDGELLTEVIKNAVAAFVTNEGSASSTAGDGSRWGAYKTAEAARDTARETAEGTNSSAANNNTRWGAYKLAEAAREQAFANWFSKATTGVQDVWTAWFNETKAAWTNWFSKAGTGVQAIWTAWFGEDDNHGVRKQVKDAVAGAENVDASLSGTTITVTDRTGHSENANLKGDTGDAAGFGNPTTSVQDNTPGTPSVEVSASGPDTAKVFAFTFHHLKGDKGDALNYSDMTPQEKQDLIDNIKEDLIFASDETCESIIDELV